MMSAAVLHAPGPPEALRIEEIRVPVPTTGEVLVHVAACGVSFRDVVERNGTYRRGITFPHVMGLEIAGTVVTLGPGARRLKVGDRVCSKAFSACGDCRWCRTGRETACPQRRAVRGGYGQFTALPEDVFVPIPDSLPFEAACSLGPGAGVALNAVRDTARVQAGETVLVTGATGGVGLPAVQMARHAGARVIAVTRGEARREALLAAGAQAVVVAAAGADFSKEVLALTGGEGADVVVDTVGSAVFDAAFRSLALFGRYAFVGQLTGDSITINPAWIFFKRAQLLGVGSVSRAQLENAVTLAAAGVIRPHVAEVIPLAAIADAHRRVEAGQTAGRIVVTP